jgi:D-serine deaminase-like pyridoxal phosphate-dependent protein
MAIKQPLINLAEQLAELRRLTAKPAPVRIFLDKGGLKRARATRVPADSLALAIVGAAEQGIVGAGVQTAVGEAATA